MIFFVGLMRTLKKIPFMLLVVASYTNCIAQFDERYLSDAILFSSFRDFGSARSLSVGNAGTAGSLESTWSLLNPASLASFQRSELEVSFGLARNWYSTSLAGQETQETKIDPVLNHVGLVFFIPGKQDENNPIKGQNLSVTVNRLSDFTNDMEFAGANDLNGISDFFIQETTGTNSLDLDGNNSLLGLAFEKYLFDADGNLCSNYNCDQYARIFPFSNLNQSGTFTANGNQTQWDIAYSLKHKKGVDLGVKFGISSIRYEQEVTLSEQQLEVNEGEYIGSEVSISRDISGNGLNLGIGLIYHFSDRFSMGFGFNSGTSYSLKENVVESIRVDFDGLIWTNPFDPQFSDTLYQESGSTRQREVKYEFTNPYRINLGATYSIPEAWTFMADFEFVPYSRLSYDFESANLDTKWNELDTDLKNGFNLRIGVRRHFSGQNALGFGFRYFGDPSGTDWGKTLPNLALCLGYGSDKISQNAFEWFLALDYYLPRDSSFQPYQIEVQEQPRVDLVLSQIRLILSGAVRF